MESEPTKNMENHSFNHDRHQYKDDLSKKLATLALLSYMNEDIKSGPEYPNIPFGD